MSPVLDSVVYVVPEASSWVSEMAAVFSAGAAFFSVITAGLALWYTRKQIKDHERHNRLMATPHISGWTYVDSDKQKFQFTLENTGIGPAVIRSVTLHVGEEQIKGWSADLIDKAVKKLYGPLERKESFEMFMPGDIVPPGKKYVVISMKLENEAAAAVEEHILANITLKISYDSILGDSYKFDSEELMRQRAAALM